MFRRIVSALICLMWVSTASAADKVVLQLRWDHQFQFAGYYVAKWLGYYEEAGLDVEIRSAITPERQILNSITEVREGRADFGISAADILIARDQGAPLVVVSSVFQQSPVGVISRRENGVTSPADLTPLRVRHVPNDVTSVEMSAMMRAEGLDIDRLPSFQPFDTGDKGLPFNLLADGTIDAYSGYSWTAQWRARQEGIEVSILKPSAYGIDFYGDALFAHERLTEENPDLVKRFTAASMRGWQYALENPDAVADRISAVMVRVFKIQNQLGFNRFQAQEVSKLTLFPLIRLGHTNPDRWRRMHETLKAFGIIQGDFSERDVIFNPEKREQERLDQWRTGLVGGGSIIGLLVIVVVLWNALLRRQIRSATTKLVAARDQLEERVQERTRELNITQERLSSTLEAIDEAAWDWNVPTKAVVVGSNWNRIFGVAPSDDQMVVDDWIERLHPDDMPAVMKRIEDHFQGRSKAYASEHRMLHADGHWLWVLDRGQVLERDENGHPIRMVGAVLDITQRKQDEDMLRKLSRAVDQNPSAIFITDPNGTIEYVNAKFTAMTGYSADEAVGQNPRILKYGSMPSEFYTEMWQTIKRGQDWRGEIQDRRKDGSYFWAYETIAPVKNEDGEITHFIATHEDITQRKDAEIAAQHALQEADVANRAKSELMANMSHELRTPLNAIIGFSSTIREEVFGPVGHEKYREYIDDISSSGQHLLDLISDILDVSAIEAGKLELHEEELDIRELAQSAIRLVLHRAHEGGVNLELDVCITDKKLNADPRRMKQILLNLLSNAVKFTPEGGVVTLTFDCDGEKHMLIKVHDTGVGMTAEELYKAMSPFGQVGNDSSTRHEGTGLGLPLCKGLVELHGGTLQINSSKTNGTEAIVTLPAERLV